MYRRTGHGIGAVAAAALAAGSLCGCAGIPTGPGTVRVAVNAPGESPATANTGTNTAFGEPPVCDTAGLAATTFIVKGSQGMGHELLNVTLINLNDPTCTLDGFPGFQLMGEDQHGQPGADQPTIVIQDPAITKTLITLAPNREASTTVRIDDDVPAAGEPESGPCEPDSYYLGVTPPGNANQVIERINGPMATAGVTVCEHGTLDVLAFVPGPLGPNQA
jgi:hypothetical protein